MTAFSTWSISFLWPWDGGRFSRPRPNRRAALPAVTCRRPTQGPTLDEMLLFFPSKFPDGNWKPDGLKFEDGWFNAKDGPRIHGWYCPCDNPRAVLLFARNAGNLTNRAGRMKSFQKRTARFRADLRLPGLWPQRRHAHCRGRPRIARAARKYLAAKAKVDESQIVLMGDSLGGAVVADLAGRDGARGLILQSTFSSLHDVAAHHYPKLAWLVPEDKLNSAARLAKYEGPLLQSHGDADQTIPFALGKSSSRPRREKRILSHCGRRSQ